MLETTIPNPSDVSETLFITLYLRAMESQRSDALFKDDLAVALVKKISDDRLYDFSRMNSLHLSEANKLVIILRSREFDRYAQDFLARHPDSVVVHIGCGLDTRFERVDNGQVEWYDLDLPHVADLHRRLVGGERERYHLLGCSVLDSAWLDTVSTHGWRPFLFLAEGVFMYFEGAQVKSLVLTLRDRFPGAELVFDAYSPIHVWRHNLQMSTSKINFPARWGIWHGQKIEGWGDTIRLLEEWGFFDRPISRLNSIRWMRPIETLARTIRIYHFQLGEAPGHIDLEEASDGRHAIVLGRPGSRRDRWASGKAAGGPVAPDALLGHRAAGCRRDAGPGTGDSVGSPGAGTLRGAVRSPAPL